MPMLLERVADLLDDAETRFNAPVRDRQLSVIESTWSNPDSVYVMRVGSADSDTFALLMHPVVKARITREALALTVDDPAFARVCGLVDLFA